MTEKEEVFTVKTRPRLTVGHRTLRNLRKTEKWFEGFEKRQRDIYNNIVKWIFENRLHAKPETKKYLSDADLLKWYIKQEVLG